MPNETHVETYHVLEAVREAFERCGTPAILNSDQGSQLTGNEYRILLKEYHITQSMDGRKRWADNIIVERWFRSLLMQHGLPNHSFVQRLLCFCLLCGAAIVLGAFWG